MTVIDLQYMIERPVHEVHAVALKAIVFERNAREYLERQDEPLASGLRLALDGTGCIDDLHAAIGHCGKQLMDLFVHMCRLGQVMSRSASII